MFTSLPVCGVLGVLAMVDFWLIICLFLVDYFLYSVTVMSVCAGGGYMPLHKRLLSFVRVITFLCNHLGGACLVGYDRWDRVGAKAPCDLVWGTMKS